MHMNEAAQALPPHASEPWLRRYTPAVVLHTASPPPHRHESGASHAGGFSYIRPGGTCCQKQPPQSSGSHSTQHARKGRGANRRKSPQRALDAVQSKIGPISASLRLESGAGCAGCSSVAYLRSGSSCVPGSVHRRSAETRGARPLFSPASAVHNDLKTVQNRLQGFHSRKNKAAGTPAVFPGLPIHAYRERPPSTGESKHVCIIVSMRRGRRVATGAICGVGGRSR